MAGLRGGLGRRLPPSPSLDDERYVGDTPHAARCPQ